MKRILSVVLLGVFGAVIPGTAAGAGKIFVMNNTCEDLRIAVHFKDRSTEQWRTEGDWILKPGEITNCLAADGKCLRGKGDYIYYWAEGSNGYECSGDLSVDGRRFKKIEDPSFLFLNYDYDHVFGGDYCSGNCPDLAESRMIKLNRENRNRCYSRCVLEAETCKQQPWKKVNCSGVESACRGVCDSDYPDNSPCRFFNWTLTTGC